MSIVPLPQQAQADCRCCAPALASKVGKRTTRRAFLAAGAGAFACTLPVRPAPAQSDVAARRIIDVHHHIAPPSYLTETRARQNPPSLEDMDKAGVQTAINPDPHPRHLVRRRRRRPPARAQMQRLRGATRARFSLGVSASSPRSRRLISTAACARSNIATTC